jgi:hypothetical protein
MELRIDRYIQELLFNHNCVIIPSFGGFVGNYKGAEIHPTQHIFTAPCKQLAFNKNLIINDGLLANYIVQIEKVTYPEALEIIDKDVFKIKHLLSSGEKAILKSIGFFRLDVEKNIQFSPSSTINFATSSFGLQSFQSSAIRRGGFVTDVGKTFLDRPSIQSKRSFKKYKKFVVPALILPVAMMLFLSPFSGLIKDKIQLQTSGFFSKNESKEYKPKAHQFSLPVLEIRPMRVVVENNIEEAAKEIEDSFAVADSTKVSAPMVQPISQNIEGSFTLISGCFAIVENAEKQVEQLKQKNINASIIGKTKNGLYRVGCGSFNSSVEANAALMSLKAQDTEAWVLKN